ncbi:MAG: hypothetical protein A3F70_02150 [Acidobacteria bacterium RIFCSPLOWO2_12_FULL_67_14]|nr:MAG: hypothetical protein A3H29_06600 [Acidobacteria bacterium RIFCSPLOWO2_02_FULL_67_21]OFW39923.1 MAG: hypothetical protein A3F70_02150 [Acidobacteria bacterium RIFCSPLOWO2_12_FULL_67_14]
MLRTLLRFRGTGQGKFEAIRFRDVPDVDIVTINRPEMPPFGAGEASSIATAAAIANAIFDAVGGRPHRAPFTPARVLAALDRT